MVTIYISEKQLDKDKLEALKALLKALKIKFEFSMDKPYDKKFVEKIEKSIKEVKQGKTTRVKKENLKNFLGI